MPEFFKTYLKSLTDKEANELALWFDSYRSTDNELIETLIQPRPQLHAEWNFTTGSVDQESSNA